MAPAVAAPVAVGAAVVGAVGSVMEGKERAKAAQAQAQAQAQADRYNAQMSEQQAAYYRQKAKFEEGRFRRQSLRDLGKMRASYAAAGVELAGSPLDVLEEDAAIAEMDALLIRHDAEVKGTSLQNSARLDRYSADSAIAQGNRAARSARILGGVQAAGYLGRGLTSELTSRRLRRAENSPH